MIFLYEMFILLFILIIDICDYFCIGFVYLVEKYLFNKEPDNFIYDCHIGYYLRGVYKYD